VPAVLREVIGRLIVAVPALAVFATLLTVALRRTVAPTKAEAQRS
jgi:hypothetical protein